MATAKKLPSGSWRVLVYSHTEKVVDEKTGQLKDKRIYESFTSDDPSKFGKREAERAANQFLENRTRNAQRTDRLTLREGVNMYIDRCKVLGRSPTTIHDYEIIRDYAFQNIMDDRMRDLNEVILQEAILLEAQRPSGRCKNTIKPITAKRLQSEWILIGSVLRKYRPGLNFDLIELPAIKRKRPKELLTAEEIMRIVKGSDVELAVLLAAWLSFTLSEVRGLTKSGSISKDGNLLTINQVIVNVGSEIVTKPEAKNDARNRTHRIPPYIKQLIDKVDGDVLVPMHGHVIYNHWIKLQKEAGVENPISFHDLRHVSASIMALLHIPDKYAQERGGWKSDRIMKTVYQQTFSAERIKVDDMMDAYFEHAMQHDMQHEKRKAL